MSTPSQDPNKKEEEDKGKLKKSLDSFLPKDKVDKFYEFASSNTRDTLAYILMLTGLILLFFEPAYAGTLIGVIVGLYFSDEIVKLVKNYRMIVDKEGNVRSLILAGLLVALFISAPFIFFGIIVAVGVKQLID